MSTGEKTAPAPAGGEEGRSALRFLIVSAAAFCLDLALALATFKLLKIPVWLAAAIAYGVVASAFYFVHEHWTFAHPSSRNSARRLAQTVVSAGISLAGRVGLIRLLEVWHEPHMLGAAGYIWLGAIMSLMINYTLSRFWVFARR
jgi:putative flippase GtrA